MSGGTALDLKLIDDTYGKNADLYEDVLRVPTTATHDEIQLAYFDRRSELFTLLAKIDASARGSRSESSLDQNRYLAEKKMDSVVFAVRILADPSLRKSYDGMRPGRTGSASTSIGYALKQSRSHATENSATSRSSSAASESSTMSSNNGKKQQQPRVVTPTESPPVVTASSSASESKNWVSSTFSGSLFSFSKTGDESEEYGDEERNPRKTKRRQKQQRASSSSSLNREELHESQPEEKEKKSIWGRKKRKKKKLNKDENGGISLNESMDTNATDTSMTDHEDGNYRNRNMTKDADNQRPILKRSTSQSHSEYDNSTQDASRRGGERRRNDPRDMGDADTIADTIGDDDTRRDDDTRTYLGDDGETFATLSSNAEELQEKATCGDSDGMFGCLSGSKAFRRIATEVSGACEDTLVSVDQVFNAFTLTDKDIKAVKKKIDKAKRQLDN